MTRINVVPVTELCDEHLRAEHRELTRIPNALVTGRMKPQSLEGGYRLGQGHVRFFTDKLRWLKCRYESLLAEMQRRGFKTLDRWPPEICNSMYAHLWNEYEVTEADLSLNRQRIQERWPKNAHYNREKCHGSTDFSRKETAHR